MTLSQAGILLPWIASTPMAEFYQMSAVSIPVAQWLVAICNL